VVFGVWSKKEGLQRLPVDPSLEIGYLSRTAEELHQILEERLAAVPFPRRDRVELWLLDASQYLPLALLASTLEGRPLPVPGNLDWHCAPAHHRDITVLSKTPEESTAAPTLPGAGEGSREILQALVRSAAGNPRRAQWFRRDAEGGGVGLGGVHIEASWQGRRLPKGAFPTLPLREHCWERPEERRLVEDFHDWQAPFLLTLEELPAALRDRLERAACRQSTWLYAVHRLYPVILNQDLVKAALVEAVIRNTS
jgi:hypothetical protein